MQNRKFQSGKQAKKLAEEVAMQREMMKKQAKENGVDSEEEEFSRGPSLMEQHTEKRQSKMQKIEDAKEAYVRRPFDREKVKSIINA